MKVAVLAGDGIGPDVMNEAIKVLERVAEVFDHDFEYVEGVIGGSAWDKFGEHFPEETKIICDQVDAILFGSVGGPVLEQSSEKWMNCEKESILGLRKYFDFNINFRPVRIYEALSERCVLKDEIIKNGVDILCVRELSSGIYFGEHKTEREGGEFRAFDVMEYSEWIIEKIARAAFEAAMKRRKKVTSVDKANVLDCSKLWRKVVSKVADDYPECELEHILVDNCVMQVLKRPSDFDVLLLPNMFGDIISDEISVFAGSLGMLPSASLNSAGFGMYEPSGGSAPDIAGQGVANPIAQILSAAMMLKYSFSLNREADVIIEAVEKALNKGYKTVDICSENSVSTMEMGDCISAFITK